MSMGPLNASNIIRFPTICEPLTPKKYYFIFKQFKD